LWRRADDGPVDPDAQQSRNGPPILTCRSPGRDRPTSTDAWHDVEVLLPGPALLLGVAIIVGGALLISNWMSRH